MGCSFSRVWRGWTQTRYRVSLIWTTLAKSRKWLPLASPPPAGSGRSPVLGGECWVEMLERKCWRAALERTVRRMGALADRCRFEIKGGLIGTSDQPVHPARSIHNAQPGKELEGLRTRVQRLGSWVEKLERNGQQWTKIEDHWGRCIRASASFIGSLHGY
jgi:hypothetical protein